jgi:hypothetical protein
MPELSNLLRQRLALAESADGHPDADTLTAFTEKLLPAPEQSHVLEHVAFCSQCRDVIALSLESVPVESSTAAAVAPAPTRARRAWAPLFGLAASFAAVAVVAVLIVKQPHKSQPAAVQNYQEAKSIPPPSGTPSVAAVDAFASPTQKTPSEPSAIAGRTAGTLESSRRKAIASASLADREATAPPLVVEAESRAAKNVEAIAASAAAPARRDYVNSKLFTSTDAGQDQNVAAVEEIPNSRQGNASSLFQNQSGFATNTQVRNFADLPAPAPGSRPIQSWTPSTGSSSHGPPLFAAIKREARQIMQMRPPISSSALGLSTMGGQSPQFNPTKDKGQSVEVTAASAKVGKESDELDQSQAFTKRALSPTAAASVDTRFQPSWAVGDGKLLKTNESGAWVSGYSGTEIEFSHVTFHGFDVWAGGTHAALLHSRDAGATWERPRLGPSASGSVTSIVANGQNVQVTTSEGQTWTTDDGGKTWTPN